MQDPLRRRNEGLRTDITAIIRLSTGARIVSELEPYRTALLRSASELLVKVEGNLTRLGLDRADLLPDILSETSTLIQWSRLFKFRFLRALQRASEWDRVCLRTLSWLHSQHADTVRYPPVFADDDISIIPSIHLIPFYFFPCLEQRTLRFQPLFFHEFGHLLYQCHRREMDDLVGDFQQNVETALLPASQRNDQYSQTQTRTRQSVVETWYSWTQEFFCDAVGLVIGGPSFVYAFAEYMAKYLPGDYYRQPADLHGSTHPVSWLRIRMLAERARQRGHEEAGERVLEQWRQVGELLGIQEDYHGFYTDSLESSLVRVLDDMLLEASPRECTAEEACGEGWEARPSNISSLMNRVWLEHNQNVSNFGDWEIRVLRDHYSLGSSNP